MKRLNYLNALLLIHTLTLLTILLLGAFTALPASATEKTADEAGLSGFRHLVQSATPLPETTPWDLETLSKPPVFEWSEGTQIQHLRARAIVIARGLAKTPTAWHERPT